MPQATQQNWTGIEYSHPMTFTAPNGDVFETESHGMLDVTSLSRPDPTWRFVDAHGHVHRWFGASAPVLAYDPLTKYRAGTLVRVTDAEPTDEYPGIYHWECRRCRETIERGFTADAQPVYTPGVRSCLINGRPVSQGEFKRRLIDQTGWRA